jgi:hypothetical protein
MSEPQFAALSFLSVYSSGSRTDIEMAIHTSV